MNAGASLQSFDLPFLFPRSLPNNQEHYDRVLGGLLDQLSRAETLGQWQRPWKEAAGTGVPANPVTGRRYQGVNVLALWAAQVAQGYDNPYWAGFRQWRQIGAHERQGERGTPVLLWRVSERERTDPVTGECELKTMVYAAHKAVFNALLTGPEGCPPHLLPTSLGCALNFLLNPPRTALFQLMSSSIQNPRVGQHRLHKVPQSINGTPAEGALD